MTPTSPPEPVAALFTSPASSSQKPNQRRSSSATLLQPRRRSPAPSIPQIASFPSHLLHRRSKSPKAQLPSSQTASPNSAALKAISAPSPCSESPPRCPVHLLRWLHREHCNLPMPFLLQFGVILATSPAIQCPLRLLQPLHAANSHPSLLSMFRKEGNENTRKERNELREVLLLSARERRKLSELTSQLNKRK